MTAGPGLPAGVRFGVDPGDARIGVARTDPSAVLATPEETVARSTDGGSADLDRLAALVEEAGPWLSMSGCRAR